MTAVPFNFQLYMSTTAQDLDVTLVALNLSSSDLPPVDMIGDILSFALAVQSLLVITYTVVANVP